MKRTKLAASFLLAGTLLLTGCVSKKELVNLQTDYNKLKDEKTALDKSYQDAQIQLAEYRTQSKSLEDRLNEARKNNQELRNSYATLQGSLDKSLQQNSQGNINISKLVDEINASNRYIKQLVDTKSKSDSLNVVLTNNLTRSLSREELKEVDVKVLKGVVYISLADNMLYKSKPTFSLLLITTYLSLFSEVVFVNNVQFIVKFEYQWWEVWNFNIHDFVI